MPSLHPSPRDSDLTIWSVAWAGRELLSVKVKPPSLSLSSFNSRVCSQENAPKAQSNSVAGDRFQEPSVANIQLLLRLSVLCPLSRATCTGQVLSIKGSASCPQG